MGKTNIYTKPAIITAEQLEAVDKVICFLMDNWKRVAPDPIIERHLAMLDEFVQTQW